MPKENQKKKDIAALKWPKNKNVERKERCIFQLGHIICPAFFQGLAGSCQTWAAVQHPHSCKSS